MIDYNNRVIWDNNSAIWNLNPYIWSDILIELTDGGTAGPTIGKYQKLSKKKRRKVIKLICDINGVEYKEEKFQVLDSNITIHDIEMIVEKVNKHINLEVHV
jgi:hypothetical protein